MKALDKVKSYFEDYTRTDYFTERVFKIRDEIGIPKNGIPLDGDTSKFTIDLPASVLGIKYNGKNYHTFPAKMTKVYSELLEPIPAPYKVMECILFFNIFILYNIRQYETFTTFYNGNFHGVVALYDYSIDFLERKDCCDCVGKVCETYMDETSKKHPVTIGISPYATQNEVINYIKDRWDYIQFHFQMLEDDGNINKYSENKRKLGKVRKKKVISQHIEDIVYSNKNLKLVEIGKIIKDTTGKVLDQGEIEKVRNGKK